MKKKIIFYLSGFVAIVMIFIAYKIYNIVLILWYCHAQHIQGDLYCEWQMNQKNAY